MSDDELRALERNVTDATSRLHYADALLRVGRSEDGLRALLAGLEDPEVRRAVPRFVPRATPIERTPKLLWRYDKTKEDTGALHANAFAVAVSVHNLSHSWPPYVGGAPESHEVHVLDPATGERRALIDGYVCVGLVDEVVVCAEEPYDRASDGTTLAFDARDGRELWRLAARESGTGVHVVGRQLVRRMYGRGGIQAEVEAFSLEDPRRAPVESVAHVELPAHEPRGVARSGPWTYTLHETGVIAQREKVDAWRFEATGLGATWLGHLVVRGATLLGAFGRGGSVFCLG